MKKYISILLAVVLSASLLAGCGGGSGNSEQKPATEAKEDAAQPEENEAAPTQIQIPQQDFTRSTSLTQRHWILLKAQGCSSVPILPA